MQQHKLALVKKMTSIGVEVIDIRKFSLGPMTHETKVLEITIRSHFSKVVFNVILSSKNPIIIGLSWLILHNPQMEWHMKSLHFEAPKQKPLDCEATIINMVGETHELVLLCSKMNRMGLNACQISKNLVGAQKSKFSNPLFYGNEGIHACYKERGCILDLCTSCNRCQVTTTWNLVSIQSLKGCVWKEKCWHFIRISTIWLYDWFGIRCGTPIYNLSQDELLALW